MNRIGQVISDSPVIHRPIVSAALLALAALFYMPCAACAETATQSVTGIPVEWLFGIIGVLVATVYLDLKHEVRTIHREGEKRSTDIEHLRVSVRAIKRKLNIHSREDDEDE